MKAKLASLNLTFIPEYKAVNIVSYDSILVVSQYSYLYYLFDLSL